MKMKRGLIKSTLGTQSRAEITQLLFKFRRGAHGVARIGTTSDYDRQDYSQILCCGRDIVVIILILKCQKQKVHGELGSTESLVRFLISANQDQAKLIH